MAAALFEAGERSRAAIARMLGVSRQAVHTWHHAWKQGGADAPAPKPHGADTVLTSGQERELVRLIVQGPGAHPIPAPVAAAAGVPHGAKHPVLAGWGTRRAAFSQSRHAPRRYP
ncbi:helix-turn-helix domain-containing protein [Nocardiopsis sp. FIRDI 009]|uniref:helix-turn-helix domain-containing protein n=1 Tax=Nocardiopsis sp. FIRDI 009 TaxID=714197 RepID=UPI000E24E959|nr:helix-turn-helix domain-containing protein [Nocardiopsis sp. FIRDI 009]